jgi:peptide/nickel transport system substrate-binding protein
MRAPWTWRTGVAVGLLLLATACGGDAPGGGVADATSRGPLSPVRGGTAVLGSLTDIDSWNVYISQQAFGTNLLRRIWLPLARESAPGRRDAASFVPELAERWTFDAAGTTLTLHLREAHWSDGRPVTAADVRFTWQAQTSPAVAWVGAENKRHIRDVEILDDRTLAIHFTQRYPDQFADAVEGAILPAHVFAAVPFDRWRTEDWSGSVVGSGPFVLERHEPAHEIVLARNARYFREGHPRLDRIVVRVVPDMTNLLTQLRAGAIDYVEGIPPREAERLHTESAVTVLPFDAAQYDFLGWNGDRVELADPLVRRALTLAIDRAGIVEELLYGHGRVARGPVPSSWWGTHPEIEPWPHDPDAARVLLQERGWATRDASGAPSPGRSLKLTVLTNAGNRLREEVLLKIQAQLSRVGVELLPQPLEMKTMRQRVAAGDYDGYLGGWIFSGKLPLRSLFHSELRPPTGLNVVAYSSPDCDRLLTALDAAVEVDAYLDLRRAVERRIHDDQPYTFLYESRRIAAHGSRLQGLTAVDPTDSLSHLEEIWLLAR